MRTKPKDVINPDRFAHACRSSGKTDVEISAATGDCVSPRSISTYRHGNGNPLPANRALLAKVLDVSEEWLLGKTDEGGPQAITDRKGEDGTFIVTKADVETLDRVLAKIFNPYVSDDIKHRCRELCQSYFDADERMAQLTASLPPGRKDPQ